MILACPGHAAEQTEGARMDKLAISLVPALGMLIVSIGAAAWWRRASGIPFRWYWVGAGLWTVAVIMKLGCALLTNQAVIGFMKDVLPYPFLVIGGGLWVGIQSSFFEIGLTLVAVVIWRQLGHDAKRAIGIGVGAGAFEALVLAIGNAAAVIAYTSGVPGTEGAREAIEKFVAATPFFWLVAPVERVIAILCHAASRGLVLLGVARRRPMMGAWGFVLFALLDAVAGAAHLSGKIGQISMWWIELALLPFAIASVAIIRRCRSWDVTEVEPQIDADERRRIPVTS